MIDWLDIAEHVLWIFGCALALSALIYAHWAENTTHAQLRAYLKRPHLQVTFYLAGLLFALGLGTTSQTILEQIIWFALTLLAAGQAWLRWQNIRHATGAATGPRLVDDQP